MPDAKSRPDAAASGAGQQAADDASIDAVIDADVRGLWNVGTWTGNGAETFRTCGIVLDHAPPARAMTALDAAPGPLCRAIIPADGDPDQTALQALHDQGVRGLRTQLAGPADAEALLRLADRIVSFGWHVEAALPEAAGMALQQAEWTLTRMPVPLCFTGLANLLGDGSSGASDSALLLEFVQMGRFWLKLSGGDLIRTSEPTREAIGALAQQAVATRPDRLVWGSGRQLGAAHAQGAEALALLRQWFPDPAAQRQILLTNPAQLYDF